MKASFGLAAAVLMGFAVSHPSQAQEYPTQTIRIISPFTAGGSTGPLARLIGDNLSTMLKQPVVIEDRPGGNTVIGTNAVVQAAPDGHTLLLTASTHVTTPLLFKTPYALMDLRSVGPVASSEVIMVAHPSLPVSDVKSFIEMAKKRPGELMFASGGVGAPPHLSGELFSRKTGIQMKHVPYKGAGQYVIDLVAGRVNLAFISPAPALPFLQSGQLKPLAVSGPRRLKNVPNVPTFDEQGIKDLNVTFWYGVFAPAKTSDAIVQKLSDALRTILGKPEVVQGLAAQGLEPYFAPPKEFDNYLKSESEKYAELFKAAGIKGEE